MKGNREITYVDFDEVPEKLNGKNMDVLKGVESKILYTTKFNENSDLATVNMCRPDKSKI